MYKKILVINPFGIGDVLFTTPVIRALKENFPYLSIGYLCNRRSLGILENNPHIDGVYIYERDEFASERKKSFFAWLKKYLDFLDQLKRGKFDAALDFSLNSQFGFFCLYAGIKERIGFDYKGRGNFLSRKVRLSGYCDKHIVEYYADLLKYLGIELKSRDLELFVSKEDEIQAEEILREHNINYNIPLVGIIPAGGASWGKQAYFKHWPESNFAELADKIVENYGSQIIIMGDFSESKTAGKVVQSMRNKAYDLSGKTTLRQFAALLKRMKLVVTNDGGPLHMAVAIKVSTVSIFGPVDEKVYGPYPVSEKHIVVKRDISCRPCYRNFRISDCITNRDCTSLIGVDEVFAAVRRLM